MKLLSAPALAFAVAGCTAGVPTSALATGSNTLRGAPGPSGADVQLIAEDGADVADLMTHLAIDKVTIVDFSAKWCGPCRMLDGHIIRTLQGRSDLAYRKLDIGDWDSPLARHYLSKVHVLPYVIVFDKEGHEIDHISGLDEERLDHDIAK